ncbi:hypothetical protein PMI07_000860 [Rhizobium sp. CF080]|uniref:hypothetical protein n=1 Tax=Rhizobium sp. (strain CF080) TaxID=1144310 RepID=UPI000271CD1C|nr:hypothetical protein [Rhizobium sp. CF080]EUB97284.1 hypothetical protein PMI07_000860 [Rhizobium sp. CF080]
MNAARAALTRAVNRAIAEGAPIYVNQPATDFEDDDSADKAEFSFKELSPRAKERARDDYRAEGLHYDWWDSIYDDAILIAGVMGIEIDDKRERLQNGETVTSPAIYFTGFSSQGDGACFTGDWRPVSNPLASLSAVIRHAPTDERLHEIAFSLADISERCNALIPDATVTIEKGTSSYCHAYSVSIDADLPTPDSLDEDNQLQVMTWNALCGRYGLIYGPFVEEVAACLRSFMDWIYRQLEAEHEYLTSDEAVDEALADFTFDEDGNTVG